MLLEKEGEQQWVRGLNERAERWFLSIYVNLGIL